MPPEVSPRAASCAAYVAAGVNLIAAAAMLVVLAPGLPVEGSRLADRMAWIATHRALWWAGWVLWHAAAISLLGLYVALAGRWRGRSPLLCTLALLVSAAGLAADLGAEAIYMGVVPGLARDPFAVGEAAAGVLTGYLGNGLYAVAGVMLTIAGSREMPRHIHALAWLLWADAAWLSASSLCQSASGMFWATALLEPLFVVWALLLGRWLPRDEGRKATAR